MAIRDKLRFILSIKESPVRLSMSFAIGVFIGMSPFLGIHTVLGIICAYLFRLNKFVTIAGVYITNPWTIIPIYTFSTYVGARLLGMNHIIPSVEWHDLTISRVISQLGPLLKPFIIGTLLTGFISSLLSYFILYYFIRKRDVER